MTRILLSVNVQPITITGAGSKPTVPSPAILLPTASAWKATDIMKGEIAYNKTDDTYYYRNNSDVIKSFGGVGDMTVVLYDPTGVSGDAFSMAKMVEKANAKVLTSAERTILGNTSNTNTGDMSDASVKTAYENNADTNALTNAYVTLLNGLAIKSSMPNIITVTEAETISQDVDSWLNTRAKMLAMARTATALNFTNFPAGGVFHLAMTKDNTDQDLTFTLGGANLVYNIFDSANNILSRGTAVVLSGTDSTNSFVLSFYNTGITEGGNTVIEVSGTIDSFS